MTQRPPGCLGQLVGGMQRCIAPLLLCSSMLAGAAGALPRQPGQDGQARPVESHTGVDVALGELMLETGHRLRTIVSSPRGLDRGPAVLVVPWLSCATVETPADDTDGMSRLIVDLVTRSGARVWRVDKPGVGDSEGRCDETDLAMELQAYRRAFQAMRADARTDTARMVVVGISNGGGIAPLVADVPVAGYVSVGGWSGTWLEHVVWQERRRLESLRTEGVAADLARWQRFQSEFLIGGMKPGEVMDLHPELASAWRWDRATQYGRPAAFYQQLQALDLAAAWAQVQAPTLAVWGENDAVMSREESERIVRIVNRGQPAHSPRARLITIAQANHGLQLSTPQPGGQPDRVGPYVSTVGNHVVAFVRRVTGQPLEPATAAAAQSRLASLLQAFGGRPVWSRVVGVELHATHRELRRATPYRSVIRNRFTEPDVHFKRYGVRLEQAVRLRGNEAWRIEGGVRTALEPLEVQTERAWWESNVYRTLARLARGDAALRVELEDDRLVVYRSDHSVLNWFRMGETGTLLEFGTQIDAPGVSFGPLQPCCGGAKFPAWTVWPDGQRQSLGQRAKVSFER